jgi:LacI family transcriptional regulator
MTGRSRRLKNPREAARCLPNVALLIEVSSFQARGLIRGISGYAQANGPWQLHLLERLLPADVRRWLDRSPCDGLIARLQTPAIAAMVSDRGLPMINVAGTATARLPRVDTDDAAVCSMAADHLIERGYCCFGFCGTPQMERSRRRKDHFATALGRHGLACKSLDLPSLAPETSLSQKDRRALSQWIAGLPKPVGIMACNDHCGRVVLQACFDAGCTVPGEVGVIGVDNDDMVCELCSPPLSSVDVNWERAGYVAAEMLGKMLRRPQSDLRETLIEPAGVVSRRSTDATAVHAPIVAEAMRLIRARAGKGIVAMEIAQHLSVSRRFLEQQFHAVLGRTIHGEIRRARLETAQRLLRETDWKLQTIAERSGFRRAARMSAVFYENFQLRPGEYRRRMQSSPRVAPNRPRGARSDFEAP